MLFPPAKLLRLKVPFSECSKLLVDCLVLGGQLAGTGLPHMAQCWGSLLADATCQPADPGWRSQRVSSLFAHFCAGCQQHGISIPAARVAVPRRTDPPLSFLQNSTSNGPWSKRQGHPRYRTVNSTARCTGPRAVIFESPPAAIAPASASPPPRLSGDSSCSAVRRETGPEQALGWPLAVIEAMAADACAAASDAALSLGWEPPPTEWLYFAAIGGEPCVRFVLSHETLVPVSAGAPLGIPRTLAAAVAADRLNELAEATPDAAHMIDDLATHPRGRDLAWRVPGATR